jgi:hypothetical protein
MRATAGIPASNPHLRRCSWTPRCSPRRWLPTLIHMRATDDPRIKSSSSPQTGRRRTLETTRYPKQIPPPPRASRRYFQEIPTADSPPAARCVLISPMMLTNGVDPIHPLFDSFFYTDVIGGLRWLTSPSPDSIQPKWPSATRSLADSSRAPPSSHGDRDGPCSRGKGYVNEDGGSTGEYRTMSVAVAHG